MNAANRVFLNTGILYLKMLVTVGITLYTTRLVLGALGVVDYGIYNLIAGVIAMLSFLNAAMSTSTQRYLSFHQGKDDVKTQKEVFSNSLILHVIIGIIVIIILEIAAVFLFDGFLNIPEERVATAKVLYQFVVISLFFTVLSVPFTASLNAHENMLWIALVNIIEVILKLGVALSLLVFTGDKLILYGLLMALVSIVSLLLYAVYGLKKYEECTLNTKNVLNRKLLKNLTSFAGWNLFGALCGVGRTQGVAIILNLFLGTVVNAAYGIANQVSGQMNFFSATMLRALNPQIMKSEGAGDRHRMLRLSMMASKFGFFLLAFLAVPCIFEMPAILKIWLKEVPEYATIFCMLILIAIMIQQLTIGLQSAIQATGKIKIYQSVVGSILLLNIPIAYILLKMGFSAYSVLVGSVFIEFTACIFRLFFLKKIAGLSISEYINRVFMCEIIPVLSSVIVCLAITTYVDIPFRFLLTIAASVLIFMLTIYLFGLKRDEKDVVDKLIKKVIK